MSNIKYRIAKQSDIDKLIKFTGFEPKIGLDEGIMRVSLWKSKS